MFFRVSCLAENYSNTSDVNIVVRLTDTISLTIAVGRFQKLLEKHQKLKFWLEMGVETKNTLRYVTLTQIDLFLGQLLSSALPALPSSALPCLAATAQHHSLEKVNLALSNV